jgi:L-arabinokinase
VRPVFFYISGHGFGHASRQIEILNALARLEPGRPIAVRTTAPRWLFDRTAAPPLTLLPGPTDTGAVQIDSLALDADATVREAAAFHDTLEQRAAAEAALLASHDAALVVADVPPLACAAARAAGIPAFVAGNFTWDWIYAGYAPHPALERLLPRLRDAYATAAGGWRLPLHGGFETVPNIEDVPFVARHARHERAETRSRLGLPGDRPLILVSFGGFGLDRLPIERLDCLDRYGVVIPGEAPASGQPSGVFALPDESIYARGLRYEDLVGAVDVVLSKPGYGIISECIANGTALLYTSRGAFAEYDVLVQGMPQYLRSEFIAQDDLFAGRWRAALDALERQPAVPLPPTDGAEVIASRIRDVMAAGGSTCEAAAPRGNQPA